MKVVHYVDPSACDEATQTGCSTGECLATFLLDVQTPTSCTHPEAIDD